MSRRHRTGIASQATSLQRRLRTGRFRRRDAPSCAPPDVEVEEIGIGFCRRDTVLYRQSFFRPLLSGGKALPCLIGGLVLTLPRVRNQNDVPAVGAVDKVGARSFHGHLYMPIFLGTPAIQALLAKICGSCILVGKTLTKSRITLAPPDVSDGPQ